MLQDIRNNAQGTIAKVIIGVLIVSLSIWGMDAIVGGFRGEPSVATVNGDDITEREFLRYVQIETQRRLAQMENPDPSLLDEDRIRREVLESLIQEQVMIQDAVGQGFELSDEGVDMLITRMSQFQMDGRFSQEMFLATVRNLGMGVNEYREAIRRSYLVNQIANGVVGSTLVPMDTARQLMGIQEQTRTFETYTLDASLVTDEVAVSEADVEEWYNANQNRFVRPETVDVDYLVLSMAELAETMEISEADIRAVYEQRVSELEAEEERRTAHILIPPGDEAEALLEEARSRLEAGEEFASVASDLSVDVLTAPEGGDLGFLGRNALDPAYEEVMYSLEVGEYSEPVESRFGYHIIKLLDIRAQEAPGFEELRAELRDEMAANRAADEFARERTRLADLAFSEDNLEYPAEQLGLEVRSMDGITREGGADPFSHPGLVRQLFSRDVLEDDFNSEVIDVGNNRSVVARVRQHVPENLQPLEEVADNIREHLVAQKTLEALEERAQALIGEVQSGAITTDDEGWTRYTDIDRSQPVAAGEVRRQAFALPRPEDGERSFGTALVEGDLVVVALMSVTDGEVDPESPELRQLREFLVSLSSQQEYQAYQQQLREEAEVTRR